jgi:hypothetical protein
MTAHFNTHFSLDDVSFMGTFFAVQKTRSRAQKRRNRWGHTE